MQSQVKYIDRGVEHVGTYKVDGWMLELTCVHGTRRVALGLFEPKALARKLLKVLAVEAERRVSDRPAAVAAPVATIKPSRPVVPPAARMAASSSPPLPG